MVLSRSLGPERPFPALRLAKRDSLRAFRERQMSRLAASDRTPGP